jgi:hypothetical protein
VSRRASLPGADELFRRTSTGTRPAVTPRNEPEPEQESTKLQVAESTEAAKRSPRHEQKVTFYCTGEDLLALERARLQLRSEHGVAADRGRIVRAALSYVLEDFDARGDDSILLRRLEDS